MIFNFIPRPKAARAAARAFAFALLICSYSWSATPGGLYGTVLDPTGALVPGALVKVSGNGVTRKLTAGDDGAFSFETLAPGHYQLTVTAQGFAPYISEVDVSANEPSHGDAFLTIGSNAEVIEVSEEAQQIDTTSTQIGDLLTSKRVTSVPLNGRSFTDLLALQPGVVPASSAQPNAVVMSGCTATPPSGDLNPGNLSVSGQRETANGFSVNGSLAEEDFNNGTAIVPNLDAIGDLRVLTGNFDAEYGNFSGGQVMVTTKAGTDQLHGSAFEFLRNTALDARSYFATDRARYDRNQYGGTLGGPVRKAKVYFFLDYQGTGMTQGQETGNIVVPSLADRAGNLTDLASQLTGTVSTTYWASQLSQKLAYGVNAANPTTRPAARAARNAFSQRCDPSFRVVDAGLPAAAIHPDPERRREFIFLFHAKRNSLRQQGCRPDRHKYAPRNAVGFTTSSISTPWTIRIPPRRVAPMSRASMPSPRAGRNSSASPSHAPGARTR